MDIIITLFWGIVFMIVAGASLTACIIVLGLVIKHIKDWSNL